MVTSMFISVHDGVCFMSQFLASFEHIFISIAVHVLDGYAILYFFLAFLSQHKELSKTLDSY